MPRGGGGFRGSRSRSFGGGFSGGGFRGGSTSFRMGSTRPSGTPFGRTGSTRIVNRRPSGPYSHRYRRPHRRYYRRRPYWWYHRPWYYRWYSPWFFGWYYRPWYFSPALIIGGIVMFIILGVMFIPLIGFAFGIPMAGGGTPGEVTYRSTETLYFNEYWYEYESIDAGNDITFSVQSSPSNITFAVWDQPFENLPTTSKTGGYGDIFTLENNYYYYYSVFLKPGSEIEFEFESSGAVDFFLADAYQLTDWNQGENPSFDIYLDDVSLGDETYKVGEAKDYYLVWYNEGQSQIEITYDVEYTAQDVYDFSVTDFYMEAVNEVPQQSITVPNEGRWYFFVYFDPMNSPEESTEITFDVTYETGRTAIDQWINISPILIIVLVIIIIVIIVAVVARRRQKEVYKKGEKKKVKKSPYKPADKKEEWKTGEKSKPKEQKVCISCGKEISATAKFCTHCGKAQVGRKVGESGIKTPPKSKNCTFCGNKIKTDDKYCKWCGTKIGS
ncbi:MAG: hypothetical protein BAJALOKI2v1_320035 [Promethearchaeota archaeon]|nr:MAG: hypothetical protein BAJALOKI2v1_320035 [Candidatus Lokiarchaeota archaeon]